MDLQKETGLLRWEYRLKGFFEKTGRGWSRDAVTNNFWHEIEIKISRLWLALKLPYISIIFTNSEKSVQTQALIYLRS